MTAVIFDLDGTLIDSAPDIHAAVNEVMADEGHDEFALHEIIRFIGNGLGHLVELVMQARGIEMSAHEALSARVLEAYNAVDSRHSQMFEGVTDALQALKAAGYRLGVCTNKRHGAALHVLESYGLLGLFEVVIGEGSVSTRKPDPAPLEAAIEQLGAPAVFVGDSEVDEETARRAGVPFVFFTEGYCKRARSELVMAAQFSQYSVLPDTIKQITG